MNLESMEFNRARAYPVSDALQYPLTAVRNEQRVPQRSRLRLKKLVRGKEWKKKGKMRIGNWNVGSLTGKGRELIDVMQRRKIMILCIFNLKLGTPKILTFVRPCLKLGSQAVLNVLESRRSAAMSMQSILS